MRTAGLQHKWLPDFTPENSDFRGKVGEKKICKEHVMIEEHNFKLLG